MNNIKNISRLMMVLYLIEQLQIEYADRPERLAEEIDALIDRLNS